MGLLLRLTALLVIVDQLTKYFMYDKSYNVIGNFLRLSYTTNTGAAFGIFKGYSFLLIIIAMVAIAVLILLYMKENSRIFETSYILIIAGAAGNLIDRLFLGYVRDFIAVWVWPSFNLADIFITLGALALIIGIILRKKD